MNFDIKDVKSWATRNEVKVGDEGYFADSLSVLDDRVSMDCRGVIGDIQDRQACCFKIKNDNDFCFFLPLDAVKKDEKKYRPFKDLYEFYKFISFGCFVARKDFTQNMLLKMGFTYREKKAPRFAHTLLINRIDFDLSDDPCSPNIEGRNLGLWFDYAEIINNKGEWLPFGVEVKEND